MRQKRLTAAMVLYIPCTFIALASVILSSCTAALADDLASCHLVKSEDAVAACSRLIDSGWYQHRPKDLAVAYSNRGTALSAKGAYDEAIENLNEAIRLDPRLATAFNNRGLVWNKTKKYDQAIEDFTSAIEIDPKLFGAYKSRGLAWLAKRNFERSLADFDSAIRLNPGPVADDYLGRALARIQRKQFDLAIADLDEAIRMETQPKAVYFLNRSWARILKKDFDRAIPDLDAAIRIDPTNAVAFNNRGFIYNNKNRFDLAMTDLNEAIRLDPNSASAYKNRGISFEKKGDPAKALGDFRKAVSIDPRNREATDGVKRLSVSANETPQTPLESASATTTNKSTTFGLDYSGPIPKPGLPADQIVEQAKAFDKWINDPTRVKPTEVNEALRSSGDIGVKDAQVRTSLRSIQKSSGKYSEAQKMLADFAKQDVETKKQLKEVAQKYLTIRTDLRKVIAKQIQTNYWEAGLDVTTSVSGPHNTILNLRYVLFSNPLVHKLVNAESFTDTCRKIGFTKILFFDGYNKTWSYSLIK